MSQDGCTSGSGSRLGSGSREGVDDYKPPVLTEDLLVLHNREMEREMVSKFKEAKRIGELGFLKDKTKALGQSESKRVLVKAKVKADETVSKRQHLSTIPENVTKSVSALQVLTNHRTACGCINQSQCRRAVASLRSTSDPWPSLTPTSARACTAVQAPPT